MLWSKDHRFDPEPLTRGINVEQKKRSNPKVGRGCEALSEQTDRPPEVIRAGLVKGTAPAALRTTDGVYFSFNQEMNILSLVELIYKRYYATDITVRLEEDFCLLNFCFSTFSR